MRTPTRSSISTPITGTSIPRKDGRNRVRARQTLIGGGHAHVGAMIYLGDNWPAEYRGDLFTLNMHGFRANREKLERSGSGYVGRHGQDFVTVADTWFRGIELSYGPDGGVFVLDWSDTGECHESNGVHRTSGRIYRIAYGETKAETGFDLAKLSESELVELHTDKNEWFVRQARLALANRAARGEKLGVAPSGLRALFKDGLHDWHKLRALSTLYAIGAADPPFLRAQLQHENEHVRAWAVRLLTDAWRLDTSESERPAKADAATTVAQCRELLPIFTTLVRGEKSGLVRLALASTLQRLPVSLRVPLAAELVKRPEDGDDHNLPLMVWYGLIPVAEHDQASLAKLTPECHLPLTRRYIVRRLAEDLEKDPGPLNEVLSLAAASPSSAFKYDVLGGLSEALTGWRKAAKPTAWEAFAAPLAKSTETAAQDLVRDLNVVFGDGRALDAVKKIALDETAAIPVRKTALQTLIDSRAPDLREICEKLLEVSGINPIAARGLATFDDPAVAAALVKAYRKFRADDRPQLLAALVSRPSFAGPLLDAIAKGAIPRGDLTPFHARQIRGFNDLTLQRRLTEVWGDLREAAADKQEIIAKLKQQLTPALLAKSDLSAGRAAFAQVCAGLPPALRRGWRGRTRSHRHRPGESRLPSRKHHRPQRRGHRRLPHDGGEHERRPRPQWVRHRENGPDPYAPHDDGKAHARASRGHRVAGTPPISHARRTAPSLHRKPGPRPSRLPHAPEPGAPAPGAVTVDARGVSTPPNRRRLSCPSSSAANAWPDTV